MAKSLRLGLGARIIQAEYGYSDAETPLQIQENPYLQYFCGYKAFDDSKPPFDRNRSITTPKNPSIVADGGCSYVGLIILRPEACVFRFPLSSCRSRA